MVEVREDGEAEAPIRDQPDDRRASFDAARVDGDELAAIVLQNPAEAVRLEMRMRQPGGRIERALHDLLRPEQLGEVRRADQAPPRDLAAVEHEAQPFRHVGRGREDRAGGRDIVDAVERGWQHAHRVAHDAVGRGDVADTAQLARVGKRLRHAERAEDAGVEQGLPARARGVGRDVSRQRVGDVVVLEPGAEAGLGRHESQAVRDRREIEPARAPQVVRICEAHTVRQQVTDRDLARHVRIGELHAGDVLLYGVVERQAARVGEHRYEHRGERLGRGHVAEARVHRHGIGFAELADAVAFDEDDGVVFDDDHGEARDAPILHGLGDVGIEAGERLLLR